MEINAEIVRGERLQRGWTQQHLADAAGCSLRTVQRIEKHGVASHESVSALCAVFKIERNRLLADSARLRAVTLGLSAPCWLLRLLPAVVWEPS